MALQSKKIFIDSSVLMAFIDRSDTNHSKAANTMESIAKLGFQTYTSYLHISETYATLTREVGGSVALDFLQAVLQSDMEIIFPQKADLISANRMLRSNRSRQISLREVITAILMQKRGVIQILTFNYWHNLFGTYASSLLIS